MLDWSKLVAFKGDQKYAFEELCCQLFRAVYGHGGEYRRIGGPGSRQRGVEAIILKPDGSEIGLQAKWFYPHTMTYGGRTTQVEKSLKEAKERKNLKMLVVAFPLNLDDNKTCGYPWWDRLSKKLGLPYELERWDQDKMLGLLTSPDHIGRRVFWFGELVLDPSWSQGQVAKEISNATTFARNMHVTGDTDSAIARVLGDESSSRRLRGSAKAFAQHKETITTLVTGTSVTSLPPEIQAEWGRAETTLPGFFAQLDPWIDYAEHAGQCLAQGDFPALRAIQSPPNLFPRGGSASDLLLAALSCCRELAEKTLKAGNENLRYQVRKLLDTVYQMEGTVSQMFDVHRNVQNEIFWIMGQRLILLARPGVGKTHAVCSAAEMSVSKGGAAVLLLGKGFRTQDPLEQQARIYLDIPPAYSWENTVAALETAAETYLRRLLFVIDGVNESPAGVDLWRTQLPGFVSKLTRTPWISVVLTARESYAEPLFGDRLPKYGHFLRDDESIEEYRDRYLAAYRMRLETIGPGLHEALNDRFFVCLFCKTYGNPNALHDDVVSGEEISLPQLYEEFLRRSDRRVAERLKRPATGHVRKQLVALAKGMWEKDVVALPKADALTIIDEQSPSKVNVEESWTYAMRDEGLLIDTDWSPEGEVFHFSHQSLGEYLIASYLVNTNSEAVLRRQLSGSKHPRLPDILEWVACLLPEKRGRYLYHLDLSSKRYALAQQRALYRMATKHITPELVSWQTKRFENYSDDERKHALGVLSHFFDLPNHPLNTSFLDSLLRPLSLPDRDLSWSEWLRENAESLQKELDTIVEALGASNGNVKEQGRLNTFLRAVMWMVTSSNRALRDRATRALYFWGRTQKARLFDLARSSFALNDSYVPERMIGVCYGLAMAEPKASELSGFAREVHKAYFKKGAPHATTHLLMRDCARHLLELVHLHHPTLFSPAEVKRFRPPFREGGIRRWKSDREVKAGKSRMLHEFGHPPIGMDFAKYIIGPLHQGDKHKPLFRTSLARVLWRIKQLGWRKKRFDAVDRFIGHAYWEGRISSEEGKVERYSKKYQWIALFELAGYYTDTYRTDHDPVANELRYIHRRDIDPSFPDKPRNFKVVGEDLLGNRRRDILDWVARGKAPDLRSALLLDELDGEKGPWAALDGYLCREESTLKRGIFAFIRGMLVPVSRQGDLLGILGKLKYPGNRAIPEYSDDYYVFSGEVPWADTFPLYSETPRVTVQVGTRRRKLSEEERAQQIQIQLLIGQPLGGPRDKEVPRYVREPITESCEVQIPVRALTWESYHSIVNPGQHAYVPSREIAELLGLRIRPQTCEMEDASGKRATISTGWGDDWRNRERIIYLRCDLLNAYLHNTKQALVWVLWGEREFRDYDRPTRLDPRLMRLLQARRNVFKQVVEYR